MAKIKYKSYEHNQPSPFITRKSWIVPEGRIQKKLSATVIRGNNSLMLSSPIFSHNVIALLDSTKMSGICFWSVNQIKTEWSTKLFVVYHLPWRDLLPIPWPYGDGDFLKILCFKLRWHSGINIECLSHAIVKYLDFHHLQLFRCVTKQSATRQPVILNGLHHFIDYPEEKQDIVRGCRAKSLSCCP